MQEKNILLCFLTVPLRHKVVAAALAVAVAGGAVVWSRHGAMRLTTTADVSFDADEARRAEPAIVQAPAPAVALAQSILNDESIRGLTKRTDVKSDVAEFRSRLEMTQPSANSLHINFHGIDRENSVAMANAVANFLVSWKPATAVALPAPVATTPAATIAAPAAARPHAHKRDLQSQTVQSQNLKAQLTAVDQRLAALDARAAQASAARKAEGAAHVSNTNTEQLHLLDVQLSAAQKKLDDLRLRYTDEYPDVEAAKENVAEIQQKLASLRPVSNEAEPPATPPKPEATASEASQLRRERTRLVEAIAAETRREAKPQGRGAPPAPVKAVSSQPQSAAVVSSANADVPPVLHGPFTLVRLATHGEPGSWWHGVLVGILCGFVYLISAVWRYLPRDPLVFKGDLSTEVVEPASRDLASWETEIKQALAMTDIGRQEEALLQREEAAGNQQQGAHGLEPGKLHYDEVSEAIRQKVKREPNSWVAHTEQARVALAGGDYDTALKEINLAITVVPEKLKPQLDRIVTQLNKNLAINKQQIVPVQTISES